MNLVFDSRNPRGNMEGLPLFHLMILTDRIDLTWIFFPRYKRKNYVRLVPLVRG